MATLNQNTAKVDPDSGAVFFKPSPELKLLMEIKESVEQLREEVHQLLEQREEGE